MRNTYAHYFHFNLKYNSVDERISVNKFAAIIGRSRSRMPYVSHSATPVQKNENIPNDKSFAEPVFHVLTTCGRKDIVVQNAATSPIICTKSIFIYIPNAKVTDWHR